MYPLFTLVGPTQSGKTSIINGQLVRFPSAIEVVKSITTREPRDPDDELHYRFITFDEVDTIIKEGRLLQGIMYDGHFYGNDRDDVTRVLSRSCGINAMVEEAVMIFRRKHVDVRVIKNVPTGDWGSKRSQARQWSDRIREAAYSDVPQNLTVLNRFPGGLADTIDRVAMWLKPQVDNALKQR